MEARSPFYLERPESGGDREEGDEAPGPGGVPKPKQWPKIITRRRILVQKKKTKYASLGAAGITWSRRAAAARAITHCVAHPTRGPLSGFFRGGVSQRVEGVPPFCSPPGNLSCPAYTTRAGSRPLGPIFPVCPRRNSLLRPPGAPKEPQFRPARGGQLSQGEVRGLCALQLFLRLPLQSLRPRLRAEDQKRRDEVGGGALSRDRWDPRADGVGQEGRFLGPRGGKGAGDGSRRGSGTA